LQEAEAAGRQAVAADPADAEAARLLGYSLLYQDRHADALPYLAAGARSGVRGAAFKLAYCQVVLGELDAAETALRAEIAAHPDYAEAHNLLGVVLTRQALHEQACAAFRIAAQLAPGSAEANNNLANALAEAGRHEEALPYAEKVTQLSPQLAEAHHNLGTLYQSLKRHEDAVASFERALALAPRMSYTLGYLVWNKLAVCRWDRLDEASQALRAQVRDGVPASPFALLAVSNSLEEQHRCAQTHVRDQLPGAPAPLWRKGRAPRERIRLAYLSADYHEHATAHLAARLFELHDRAAFEVVGLSYGADDGSPMRRRLERAFDRFADVRLDGDEAAARLLAEMEVDIAVDLKGHTTGARPGILWRRPAPVQASYLGYPGTMAAGFIDYLIADRHVVPDDDAQWYSEKLVWLPGCYQANDAGRPIAARTPTRAEAGLPERGFVFCCFNNSWKIQPAVFAAWMRLLRALPESVLWLLADNAAAQRNLAAAAQEAGVEPARLVFAPRAPNAEHLARHRLADLFLDTLPYNAHTTAADALWAGLPLVTCAGSAFAGRVATSLLHAVRLPELVTSRLEEYEALALRLAREPARLAELRRLLSREPAKAALFDTDRFRRGIESAYRTMWERWERGEKPRSFAVAPFDA
jgi:predicted O-linked N-acetylglucosamine transferase (SPINDLY family)